MPPQSGSFSVGSRSAVAGAGSANNPQCLVPVRTRRIHVSLSLTETAPPDCRHAGQMSPRRPSRFCLSSTRIRRRQARLAGILTARVVEMSAEYARAGAIAIGEATAVDVVGTALGSFQRLHRLGQ